MANLQSYYHHLQIVEITCKTTCKTPCINQAKLCANPTNQLPSVQNPPFTHNNTLCFSPTFTHHATSIVQLFYPLFHQAYYYNYK